MGTALVIVFNSYEHKSPTMSIDPTDFCLGYVDLLFPPFLFVQLVQSTQYYGNSVSSSVLAYPGSRSFLDYVLMASCSITKGNATNNGGNLRSSCHIDVCGAVIGASVATSALNST